MKQVLLSQAAARVPRYTSYPPATAFDDRVSEQTYRNWLAELDPQDPVALYLHVPFCREICWYCACNMKLVRREKPLLDYVDTLAAEIDALADALPANVRVGAIHWGGGTPTSLDDAALTKLFNRLEDRFALTSDIEIAFELDPRTFETSRAASLARLGVNRASLGVQEFDADVQAAVNRIQPFEQVADVVASLRDAGISNINFDLMYGLPKQTRSTLQATISKTLALRPDRIALFGYAHVPWTAKRQKQISEADLPGLESRFDQAEAAARALVEGGYQRIGLDHFALPQDGLTEALAHGRLRRTFQGYSADAPSTILGLGSSSISTLPQGYVQNYSETGAWSRAIGTGAFAVHRGYELTEEDRLRAHIIERIMCDMTVDIGGAAERFGFPADWLDQELAQCLDFVEDGLVEINTRALNVPDPARPALRLIASVFDAHFRIAGGRHAIAV